MASFSRAALLMSLFDSFVEDFSDGQNRVLVDEINVATMATTTLLALSHQDSMLHVKKYVEVPRYTDRQFQEHFKMSRATFEELCQWISPYLPAERSISVEKKLLATLWLISSTESFSRVADRFGLHKGTLHRVVSMICKVLTNLQAETIQWPTHTQLQTNAEEFAKTSGIPGVIGCIDGTHIRISGLLLEHHDSYLNEKGYFSMQLQVVCNKDLLFLDVYTGWPGSIPDCQVFYNSPLKQKLESGEHPVQYHLLGDSAYQLAPYLIVPFKDNGHLTALEKTFNHRHSSASKAVKTAVGLLKGKFCRLKNLDMTRSTDIPYLIFASCVLHNFIIRKTSVDNDGIDQYLYQDSDSEVESECDETEYEDNDLISSGIEKRKELAQQLLENET